MITRNINTFTWYDTETSGIDHVSDQVYQFASVKTDINLNIIKGSEKNLNCKPRIDVIPQPGAFLTHMIDIDMLVKEGMTEFELANQISNEFLSNPFNMISGYNTVSFDDEVVRRLMLRNMRDPYCHEWRDGNGRFDAYKMTQMIYAIKPDMLKWRDNGNGGHSLKLEHLVHDNDLLDMGHQAHDALSDVYATVALVKHVKEQNPKLFEYMLMLTNKDNVQEVLFNDYDINKRNPVIDVSTIYGAGKRYSSVILPLIGDITNSSKTLCVDLTKDPTDLLSMSGPDINKYLFTKRELLEDDAPRVPAVGIARNKLPAVMQLKQNTLSQDQADRMDIDLDKVEKHRQIIVDNINKSPAFLKRLQAGFNSQRDNDNIDSFKTIYTGQFFSDRDKNTRAILTQKYSVATDSPYKIQTCDVYAEALKTDDKERQLDLMLRAKWTNHFSTLLKTTDYSPYEFDQWMDFLNKSLFSGEIGATFDDFYSEVNRYKTEKALTEEEIIILEKIENHVINMKNCISKLENHNEIIQDAIAEDKAFNLNIGRLERLLAKPEDDSSMTP
jgi:exodeoxyribonuclease-1